MNHVIFNFSRQSWGLTSIMFISVQVYCCCMLLYLFLLWYVVMLIRAVVYCYVYMCCGMLSCLYMYRGMLVCLYRL